MLKTLYGKIVLILSGLFLIIGLLYILLTLFTTRLYIQEGAQRLNHDLAKYLVSQMFFIEKGKINESALRQSFDMLMKINHNIEVYLLDPNGNILSYSAPEGKVKRKSVSLTPVKHFMKEGATLPILGDDPRDSRGQKVFSASTIPLEGPLEGYLYIILGSEEYDSIAQMLRGNYMLRLSTGVAVSGLVFVFVTGLFLFRYLTGRLRGLALVMNSFKQSDFHEPIALSHLLNKGGGDEIDRLGIIFEEMSHRIIKQINEIRQVDAHRRELVTNVSHDLRTPLASLQGYIETLLLKGGDNFTRDQRLYLETALKHSKRLTKLVSELFELAKLDARQMEVHFEPFHPGELVQDIANKFQFLAEKKKVSIETDFSESLPFVFADIGLIEGALQNLIDNAIRHTQEGGTVSIFLSPEETGIRVQVRDNGCGISRDDIPYVFDRFYRAKGGNHSGSTGLGLAITKGIIELHGSHIEVESMLNAGTTFTFLLPYYKSESAAH